MFFIVNVVFQWTYIKLYTYREQQSMIKIAQSICLISPADGTGADNESHKITDENFIKMKWSTGLLEITETHNISSISEKKMSQA